MRTLKNSEELAKLIVIFLLVGLFTIMLLIGLDKLVQISNTNVLGETHKLIMEKIDAAVLNSYQKGYQAGYQDGLADAEESRFLDGDE